MEIAKNIINIEPKYSLITSLLLCSPIRTPIEEKNPKLRMIDKNAVMLKINPKAPYSSGPISLAKNVLRKNVANIAKA